MFGYVKIFLTGLGLVLIIIGVGGILLMTRTAGLATGLVENRLSQAFDAPVDVGGIQLAPLTQSILVDRFVLENPPEFKHGTAIQSERVRITFDGRTLFNRAPVVREVVFEDAVIFYRYETGRGINMVRLFERANANLENAPAFVVKEIRCENSEVHFSTNVVPLPRVGLDLVTVRLRNLNGGEPITSRQAAALFLRSVLMETLTLGGLLDPVLNPIRNRFRDLREYEPAS